MINYFLFIKFVNIKNNISVRGGVVRWVFLYIDGGNGLVLIFEWRKFVYIC